MRKHLSQLHRRKSSAHSLLPAFLWMQETLNTLHPRSAENSVLGSTRKYKGVLENKCTAKGTSKDISWAEEKPLKKKKACGESQDIAKTAVRQSAMRLLVWQILFQTCWLRFTCTTITGQNKEIRVMYIYCSDLLSLHLPSSYR